MKKGQSSKERAYAYPRGLRRTCIICRLDFVEGTARVEEA